MKEDEIYMLANLNHYHIKISKENFYRQIVAFLISYIFWFFIFISVGGKTIIDSINISIAPAFLTGLILYFIFKKFRKKKD